MSCECLLVPGLGFGAGPFGSLPFGTETPEDAVSLTGDVRMLTANTLAAEFAGDVGIPDPGDLNSPLNPNNWRLVPFEVSSVVRLVQFVQLVTVDTLVDFTDDFPTLASVPLPVFLVQLDGVLTPGARYQVELATPDTELTGCSCAEVTGLTLARSAFQTDERDSDGSILDLANPWLTRDALQLPPVLGSYQLTDTGDIGLDKSGESSLRKRIFRRVTSAVGSFFHLQGYGVDLKLKGLITPDAAERLQARVKAQVLQEPEVEDCKVRVLQVVGLPMQSVAIQAVTANGETVGLTVPISIP